jgi:hypothetical protein
MFGHFPPLPPVPSLLNELLDENLISGVKVILVDSSFFQKFPVIHFFLSLNALGLARQELYCLGHSTSS